MTYLAGIKWMLLLAFMAIAVSTFAVDGSLFSSGTADSLEASGDLSTAGWVALTIDGDSDRAEKLFRRALSFDSGDYDAVEGLAWMMLSRGYLDAASDLWADYIEAKPGSLPARCFAQNLKLFDGADNGFSDWAVFLRDRYYSSEDKEFADVLGRQALLVLPQFGLLDETRKLRNEMGYLSGFEVAGIYSRSGELDILDEFELDRDPTLTTLQPTFGEPRFVNTPESTSFVSFENILDEYSGVGYARKSFNWQGGDAILEVESDDYFVVYVNGVEVIHHLPVDEISQNIHRVKLDIPVGPVLLLVKSKANYNDVYATDNLWGFRLRLVDSNHNAMNIAPLPPGTKGGGQPVVIPVDTDEPEHFIDYFYASILAANEGKYQLAAEYADVYVTTAPDSSLFHLIAAYVRILSGARFDLAAAKTHLRMAKATDEKCVLAVEELAVFSSVEGKRDEAIKYYRESLEIKPDYISSICGLAEIAYSQGWDPETKKRCEEALKLNPRSHRALAVMGNYAFDNDGIVTALEYYLRYEELKGNDTNNLARIAECYTLLDNLSIASSYYERITDYNPYNLDGYLGLAAIALRKDDKNAALASMEKALTHRPRASNITEQYGMLLEEVGRSDESAAMLLHALELDPSDYQLRDYLIRRGTIKRDKIDDLISLDTDKLIANRTPIEEITDANSAILTSQTVYYLLPDYTFTESNHYLIQIVNANGEADWAEITFLADGGTKTLEARTHSPNGDILDAYSIKVNNGWYIISMEGVQPDSVLEVSYELNLGRRMVFDLHQFYTRPIFLQQLNNRVDMGRVVLVVPDDFPKDKFPRGYLINDGAKPRKVKGNGRTAYVFEKKDMPAILSEDFMPYDDAFMPYVTFSTLHEPGDVARWYQGEFWGKTRNNTTMLDQLNIIVDGAVDEREKASRVYYYVMENVSSSGGSIFYPSDSRDVFFNRTGRPIDRAVLMLSFYEALGIDAELVILDTSGSKDPWKVVSPEIFDTILVYLPNIGEGGSYLDPLMDGLAFGDYWNSAYGRQALFITDDSYRVDIVPDKPSATDSIYVGLDISLNDDGYATFTGEREYRGLRGTYRQLFRDPEDQATNIEYALSNLFNGATLDSYEVLNVDDPEGIFGINFVGYAPAQARIRGGDLILSTVLFPMSLSDIYASSPNRRYPLSIDRNEGVIDEVYYTLPDGYAVAEIPDSFKASSGLATYEVNFNLEGNRLYAERRLFIDQGLIPVKGYKDFSKFCAEVDRFEKGEIILRLTNE